MSEFISQNVLLVALFLASGTMLIVPTVLKLVGAGGREIGTLDTTRLMNSGNALVLDIRDNGEYNGGHLPKAKNIPLAELEKRVDEITRFKDKPVIVTCRAHGKAGTAVKRLKALGFTDLYVLAGGVPAWREASLPIEK